MHTFKWLNRIFLSFDCTLKTEHAWKYQKMESIKVSTKTNIFIWRIYDDVFHWNGNFANIMLNGHVFKIAKNNFVAHTIKCAVCAAKRLLCKWFDVKKFKNKFVCLGLNGSIGQSVKGHTMTNVHRDRAPTAAVIRMLKHAHFVLVKNWYCLSFVCK